VRRGRPAVRRPCGDRRCLPGRKALWRQGRAWGSWSWRDSLTSADGSVLILASEFAFFAWDWHNRLKDAVGDYTALPLRRGATVAHWDDGSHLSRQGRLPWDHCVSQKKKVSVSETVPTFDWEDANLDNSVHGARA